MRRSCIVILGALLVAGIAASVDLQLVVTKKTPLKGDLEDLVTFGLLKEMTCDSTGNIFSPSNRKYGSAINSVVRFQHDASSFTTFSIDSLGTLEDGTITDFDLQPNGELFVLAREVLKYSALQVPVEFGKSFLVHYAQNGKALSQLELKLDSDDFSPTAVSMLQGGEVLVVGRHLEESKTFLIAQVFLPNGNLKARFTLNPGGTKTSKGRTAGSMRVFEPTAIKANGQIYVLRGTTTEPVYVLSERGQLLKTIQLNPKDIEFDSPKILGKELIVHEQTPAPDQSGGIVVRTKPQRVDFPIFNLEAGQVVDRYYWFNETAGLACADGQHLTLIGQDESTRNFEWTVFEASPAGHAKTGATIAGRGSILAVNHQSPSMRRPVDVKAHFPLFFP